MLVWSKQPLSLYEKLLAQSTLHCDPESEGFMEIDSLEFRNAYDWLVEQMKFRVGPPPPNVQYPFWAWALLDGKPIKKPDLRRPEFNHSGTVGEHVVLELEIPDTNLLLSDEVNWNYVLNNKYLHNENGEDEAKIWFDNLSAEEQEPIIKESLFMQEMYGDIADADDGNYWLLQEKIDAWLQSLPPDEWAVKESKSWERIFDKDDTINDWEYVQATFWELRADQIKSVRKYTGLGTSGSLRIVQGGRLDRIASNEQCNTYKDMILRYPVTINSDYDKEEGDFRLHFPWMPNAVSYFSVGENFSDVANDLLEKVFSECRKNQERFYIPRRDVTQHDPELPRNTYFDVSEELAGEIIEYNEKYLQLHEEYKRLKYPAWVDTDEKDGTVKVQLFDLPNCEAYGDDIEEAERKAINFLGDGFLHFNYYEEKRPVPMPTPLDDVDPYRYFLEENVPVILIELPEDMSAQILEHNQYCNIMEYSKIENQR